MPLENLALIKGTVTKYKLANNKINHCNILVHTHSGEYRIAINSLSNDGSQVELLEIEFTESVFLERLMQLPDDRHFYNNNFYDRHTDTNHTIKDIFAIDYLRSNFLPKDSIFTPLPYQSNNTDSLDNHYHQLLKQIIHKDNKNKHARLYAFGQTWGPLDVVDKIFDFSPEQGIHNIHANQGMAKDNQFSYENGIFQDGGLIFQIPKTERALYAIVQECVNDTDSHMPTNNTMTALTSSDFKWVGLFLKFKSQMFPTDLDGFPIVGV